MKKVNILFSSAILLGSVGFSFAQGPVESVTNAVPEAAAVKAAPGAPASQSDTLAEANQAISNPITDFTMFIIENDTYRYDGHISSKSRYQNVSLIEPIIPISIGDSGWNLINRPVLPIVSAEVPKVTATGLKWDRQTGLGDMVFFSLLKPPSTGHFQWGIGPTLTMPTATHNSLGSEKWSSGPAAIALYSSPKYTFGLLAQNWWSFAGNNDREDVNLLNVQYFFTYQLNRRWGFLTAPTIVSNWEADSDERWSLPVSAGVAYSFMAGNVPCRLVVEPQYYLKQPDAYGPEWNLRVALAVVLPKW